jgi:hypothetical protein
MKIIIGFFVLLSTSMAFAGFNGNWQGWGDWTYGGSGTHCNMSITFIENTTSFSRNNGYFDCSIVGLDLEPVTFTKQGENLYDGEKLVGKVTANTLELKEAYSETVTISTSMKVEGHHSDYQEIWNDQYGNEIYKITGRLFLKDSL